MHEIVADLTHHRAKHGGLHKIDELSSKDREASRDTPGQEDQTQSSAAFDNALRLPCLSSGDQCIAPMSYPRRSGIVRIAAETWRRKPLTSATSAANPAGWTVPRPSQCRRSTAIGRATSS